MNNFSFYFFSVALNSSTLPIPHIKFMRAFSSLQTGGVIFNIFPFPITIKTFPLVGMLHCNFDNENLCDPTQLASEVFHVLMALENWKWENLSFSALRKIKNSVFSERCWKTVENSEEKIFNENSVSVLKSDKEKKIKFPKKIKADEKNYKKRFD